MATRKPPAPPLTAAELAELRRLHADGHSLTHIAQTLGRSKSGVSRIAARHGLTWDRSKTRAATAAHQADAAALRAALKIRLLQKADQIIDQMEQPHIAFSFGGRDNVYREKEMDKPPVEAIRNMMTSVGIAIQRSIDLEKIDQRTDLDRPGVDKWLAHLLTGGSTTTE